MSFKKYKANLETIKNNKIYLNIKHLDKGDYIIKIINNNKTIKEVTFTKK